MPVFLLKGLIAGVIVGFVTGSIRSWVDRFFLVLLLYGMLGLPIGEAVTVNLVVVALAALLLTLRQGEELASVRQLWPLVILPAVLGGILGRLAGMAAAASTLLGVLGVYAILVGVRLVAIRPVPEREQKAHPAWLAPVAFLGGGMAGFLSAGAKPFTVPVYNWALGHHPKHAYALSALGVMTATWMAVMTQVATGHLLVVKDLLLAVYELVVITLTALAVERVWTERLAKIVTLVIAPLLVLVGIRFILVAWR